MTPNELLSFHGETEARAARLTGDDRKIATLHLIQRGGGKADAVGFEETLRAQIEHACRRETPQVGTAAKLAALGRFWLLVAEGVKDPEGDLAREWRGFLVACETERESQ